VAFVLGGLHLAWAFGSTLGMEIMTSPRGTVSKLIHGIDAAIIIGGAAGVLMLVHRVGRGPHWLKLALTWIGGGFLFSWGLWQLINVLGKTALLRAGAAEMVLLNFVSLARLLAGLVIGLVMLFALAERRGPPPVSASDGA
jgi:hypothetical protein